MEYGRENYNNRPGIRETQNRISDRSREMPVGGQTMVFDIPTYRKAIKRTLRALVLFMLLYYVVNFIVAGMMMLTALFRDPQFIAAIMSGDLNVVVNLLTDGVSGTSLSLSTMLGAVFGTLMFFIQRKKRFFTDLALRAEEKPSIAALSILLACMFGAQIFSGLLAQLLNALLPQSMSFTEAYDSTIETMGNSFGIIYVVLVGPICEELVFRGAVLGSLRKFGANFAIVVSALFFGFFHMIPIQIPNAVFLGLLLGYAALRFSLRSSVLLHVFYNGVAMLLTFSGADELLSLVFFIVCLLVSLVLVIVYRRRLGERIRACANPVRGAYKYAFTSIPFLVYLVVLLGIGTMTLFV